MHPWRHRFTQRALTITILTLAQHGAARAQSAVGPELSFTGRVHAQFATSSADEALSSEFLLRRARVTALIKVSDLVSGKIQPDFSGGSVSLRDANVELAFSPYLNVTMGQFKRPFDVFELESSTRSLVVERAGCIRGAGDCAGVDGICTLSRLTEKLQYSDRDVGAMIDGQLGRAPVSYAVSITNGEGANKTDVNSGKSVTARIEYSILDDLEVAANVGVHDYENALDTSRSHAIAWGVDVDWGSYGPGLHVQAGIIGGQNWKALELEGKPTTFATAQGIASYRFGIEGDPNVKGVEPLLRVSWADPNTDIDADRDVLVTTGVMLHFIGRNKIAANLEMWDPAQGTGEWSLKVQTYLHF